jgi:hypothetical protein
MKTHKLQKQIIMHANETVHAGTSIRGETQKGAPTGAKENKC